MVWKACTVACGGTHVFAGLLVARLLQGIGACTFRAFFPDFMWDTPLT